MNFDAATNSQSSATLQPIQPAPSPSAASPQPPSKPPPSDAPPPPLFDAFHQLPHGDFKPQFFNPFEVKHRRRTSRAQFKVLEKTFLDNPKPNATIRRVLAQKLNMTARGVQVWFQNRRAKAKLQREGTNRRASFDSTNGSSSSPEPELREEEGNGRRNSDKPTLDGPIKECVMVPKTATNVLAENGSSGTVDYSFQAHMIDAESDTAVVDSIPERGEWSGSRFPTLAHHNAATSELRPSYALRSDMYDPLVGPLTASPSALSLPDSLHNYARPYVPEMQTISPSSMVGDGGHLHLGGSQDKLSQPLSPNIALGRRNSCPADFIQNFWNVQIDDKTSLGLPTIAEDEIACSTQNENQYISTSQVMGRRMSEPNNRHVYSYNTSLRYREQQFAPEVSPFIPTQTSCGLDLHMYGNQRSSMSQIVTTQYHAAPQLMRGHSLDSFTWSMQQQQKGLPIAVSSFSKEQFTSIYKDPNQAQQTQGDYGGGLLASSLQPTAVMDPLAFPYSQHHAQREDQRQDQRHPPSTVHQIDGIRVSRTARRGSYPLQYVNHVAPTPTDGASNRLVV